MMRHLMVDLGLGFPLHFVASREAAVLFAREAMRGGWVQAVAIDDRVDQSYPAMPCQCLYSSLGDPAAARIF
ncbi:hypothetical protein [Nocardia wallacei]|uniref:hypothetical protein n=1 Tax=Nocardia wallacei TaxID=480035 RepID=UPI00245732AD|nr:hypothetical protein [Nocardia wallacei]